MKLICFDCDSTLSSIEGIDELGRLRGPEVFARIEAMTADAMGGRIPIESIFGRRLEEIRPSSDDVRVVAQAYLRTVEASAKATLEAVRGQGWTPVIISGGFRQAIRPLAVHLGIERVEAVDLYFNADGSYAGYDRGYPTARSGGKPEVVAALRRELSPGRVAMVGDGVSDLETKPLVDLFIGFGGFAARERVRSQAGAWATRLSEVPALLAGL